MGAAAALMLLLIITSSPSRPPAYKPPSSVPQALTTATAQALLVPNGTYRGTRGWTETASGSANTCEETYFLDDIVVSNGNVRFTSDGRTWSGSIDQKTGWVNISQLDNDGQTTGLTIIGSYKNARMSGGSRCISGYFRFQ